MSCGGGTQNFRLLDGFVGWDAANCAGLTGLSFDDVTGLRLAQEPKDVCLLACGGTDSYVPAGLVLAYLPPPKLARGCGPCDWFLVNKGKLLRHDCCAPGWSSTWTTRCDRQLLHDAIAVATRGHRVAVADAGARRIWIWEGDGERIIGSINLESLRSDQECDRYDRDNSISRPGALAFTPWGELLVADVATNTIWRFGPTGTPRGKLKLEMPAHLPIRNLAAADDCSIWVVTGRDDSSLELWRARRKRDRDPCRNRRASEFEDGAFKTATIEELQKAFKPTGITAASEAGFCIDQCGPEGLPVSNCFDWDGKPSDQPIPPPKLPSRFQKGQLLTRAIDSGIPRCRWHRVRLDADVPSGTTLEIAVATSEPDENGSKPQGDRQQEMGWNEFNAGVPHHLDWQPAPAGSLDFLIDQPPGRLLYVRLRLTGDGQVSPAVRRVRLDFPRVTSLEYLPAVYRDNPEAEDFTERFLALFDAPISDLDRAIVRAPALLDSEGVPSEVLPWLGSFLDLVFDPAWTPELRRKVLRALPELYRRRGTITGLTETIKLIFGVTPAIQELATERDWGSLAKPDKGQKNSARLGLVRLFGKSRARFRLNTSTLGHAPLRSYGNPDHDPLLAQAFRLRVLIPPLVITSATARRSLEQLVLSQKPAHTVATIRFGGDGFLLGDRSSVGVDTIFGALPPPVLGEAGNIRLRRTSVLRRGPRGPSSGIRLGETSVVGVQTVAA